MSLSLSDEDRAIAETIYAKLLAIKGQGLRHPAGLLIEEMRWLCEHAVQVFASQPVLLELQAPITICGDTHGQYQDLMRLFDLGGDPNTTPYLFLGDYVDRGDQSIETVSLMFLLKIMHPDTFFILRGNHECHYINRLYGFYDECVNIYKKEVWMMFCDAFKWLPIAAIIGGKIFCIHGGLSQEVLEDIDVIRNIKRPIEVPEKGLLCDLLWSDPNPEVETWDDNERGVGACFGEEPVEQFLRNFGFDLICRAHQAVINGYEFPFWPSTSLVTIFSAANYCYEFPNKGAFMRVDEQLYCTFTQIEPKDWGYDDFNPERPGTPPRTGNGEEVQMFGPCC